MFINNLFLVVFSHWLCLCIWCDFRLCVNSFLWFACADAVWKLILEDKIFLKTATAAKARKNLNDVPND